VKQDLYRSLNVQTVRTDKKIHCNQTVEKNMSGTDNERADCLL